MKNGMIAILLAAAAVTACRKNADGDVVVKTPVVETSTRTDTVKMPNVQVTQDTITAVTPRIEVKKDTTRVTVPKVTVTKKP
ncbi:MAG: hypothetical protein JJD97_11875 [Gemmatimonadaceae bacterium]|nr:hypothetical protein [Gemmatimonadaceae bacterium]